MLGKSLEHRASGSNFRAGVTPQRSRSPTATTDRGGRVVGGFVMAQVFVQLFGFLSVPVSIIIFYVHGTLAAACLLS